MVDTAGTVKITIGQKMIFPTKKRIGSWEKEIVKLEDWLRNDDTLEYWSVDSYIAFHKGLTTFDKTICEELSCLGFTSLGNTLGLAWIRQIYLPRVKESCLRN
jgi:hypothetical protein